MQRSYSSADVSVCIPYWVPAGGGFGDLARTVAGVLRLYPDIEVSLCDDGSPIKLVVAEHPQVRQVTLPFKDHALNPCVAINAAVRHSTRPFVLLTNPGVAFQASMVESMLAACDESVYVAAACRDVDTGRWLCHSTVKGGEHGRGPMPADAGFHFCALLHRSLFDAAGGFDEAYRAGQAYDDNDFLWRLHAVGARFRLLDELVVAHKRSTTVWPAGGLERNRALFERKWSKAA